MRPDGRQPDELRPVEIATGYLKTAEGSALITIGNTQVLCAASVTLTAAPGGILGVARTGDQLFIKPKRKQQLQYHLEDRCIRLLTEVWYRSSAGEMNRGSSKDGSDYNPDHP